MVLMTDRAGLENVAFVLWAGELAKRHHLLPGSTNHSWSWGLWRSSNGVSRRWTVIFLFSFSPKSINQTDPYLLLWMELERQAGEVRCDSTASGFSQKVREQKESPLLCRCQLRGH